LIAPASSTSSDSNNVITVAETRRDCVAIVSPGDDTKLQSDTATAVSNTTTWADDITSSSYGILGSTMVYVYDKYNDKYRWIGCAGHIAGLCANTDDVAEPWFSPAGYNRGQFRGIVKLGYSPNQVQRDDLYKKRVNPIVSFPGQGTVLFGDKTALSKPSAFDRINVRRLFIVLEKAISTAAKYQLFELNDEFTRAMFRNMTEPFLRDVKGRRGIYDFAVICDETNNTGEVIDTNRFVADIYIKPARSINFITLNFIATRTGVEFSEIVGK
jgi:phage tail sheath protein FI